jgi:hypothetical protein
MTVTITTPRYALVLHGVDDGPGAPGVLVGYSDSDTGWDEFIGQWYAAADKSSIAVWDAQRGWRKAQWYVTVRAESHPIAKAAVKGLYALLLPGKGFSDDHAAYRKWGQSQGYEGMGGGWIRHSTYKTYKPIGQGWFSTFYRDANRYPEQARVILIDGRHRVVSAVGGNR